MAEALKSIPVLGSNAKPFAMTVYPGGVQLGAQRDQFPGTDTLSMSVQKAAMTWAETTKEVAAVAEGDRLANIGFFQCLVRSGCDLTVAFLKVSPELALERRNCRGSLQDSTWLQSRETKVLNLVKQCEEEKIALLVMDGSLGIAQLAERLKKQPAIQLLEG